MPPSVADNFIILKPRDEWPNPNKLKTTIVADLESLVTPVPGNRYEFLQPIQMRFNELIAGVRSELAVKIFGDNFDELIRLGNEVEQAIASVPNAADLAVEQATGLPVMTVEPKREALARHGLTIVDLQDVVAMAIGGVVTGQFYEGDRRADIVVRLPEQLRSDPDQLGSIPVPLSDGGYVPLREVADLQLVIGYNQVPRENGKRRVVVTSNVRGRDLGSFVNDVQLAIEQQVNIPPGYWVEYAGTFEQLQSASKRLSVVVPITLLIIVVLLFIALGSMKDSLVILSGGTVSFDWGYHGFTNTRHSVLHISGGWFYSAVWYRRVEWTRYGYFYSGSALSRKIT